MEYSYKVMYCELSNDDEDVFNNSCDKSVSQQGKVNYSNHGVNFLR